MDDQSRDNVDKTTRESLLKPDYETFDRTIATRHTDSVRTTELLCFVIDWTFHCRPSSERLALFETVQDLAVSETARDEVKTIMETIADALIAEGELKGELKGRVSQAKKTILRLAKPNLGEPDAGSLAEMNGIVDADRLDRILDRLFEASSVISSWADLLSTP